MVDDIVRQVADMRNKKMRHLDISIELGISLTAVARYVKHARQAGILPPKPVASNRSKVTELTKRAGIRRGVIQDVFDALSPDAVVWLTDQTIPGTSVAETLAAIVTDTHYEETHKGN